MTPFQYKTRNTRIRDNSGRGKMKNVSISSFLMLDDPGKYVIRIKRCAQARIFVNSGVPVASNISTFVTTDQNAVSSAE